jgi:hypothetical protein
MATNPYPIAGALGGQFLEPKTSTEYYYSAAAFTLTGQLLLVIPGMSYTCTDSPCWTFVTGGALGTTAASKVVFATAGASPTIISDNVDNAAYLTSLSTHVKWVVTAAIALGANSEMVGDLTSKCGAITLGAGATCSGSLTTDDGAVTFGAGATSGNIDANGAVSLGAAARTFGTLKSSGLVVLGAGAISDGAISAEGVAADDTADVVTMGAGAIAPSMLSAELNGSFLKPGDYEATTAVSLTGTLILLVPEGYTSATDTHYVEDGVQLLFQWSFTIGGAFGAAASTKVVFVIDNDARTPLSTQAAIDQGLPARVSWDITGAITIGASAKMVGRMSYKRGHYEGRTGIFY